MNTEFDTWRLELMAWSSLPPWLRVLSVLDEDGH